MFDAPSGLNFFDNGQREEQLGSPDFIETDPQGYGSIRNPITLNHYVLDGANPVGNFDLNGHEFEMIMPVLEWSADAFRAVLTTARGFDAQWGLGRDLTNSLNFDTGDPFELAQLSQLSAQLQMQDVIEEARRGVAVADYSELIDWQAIDATFNLNEQIMLDLVTAFSYAQACFAAGTPIVVGVNPDGTYKTKAIEDVRAGDRVLSRDERNAQADARLRCVEEAFSRETGHLRVLTLQDRHGQQATIRTTDGHLIWVAGRGWTEAAKLQAGDRLCDARGNESVVVLSSECEELVQPVRVYTFRVESDHTYFVSDTVGTGRVTAWVHNVCGGAQALEETLQEEKGVVNQSRQERMFTTPSGQNRIADAVFEGRSGPTAGEAKYIGNWERSIYNPESPIGGKSFAGKVRNGLVSQAEDYLSVFKTVEYYSNSREFIQTYSHIFEQAGIDMRRVAFIFRP
jgi:hypothetical protein